MLEAAGLRPSWLAIWASALRGGDGGERGQDPWPSSAPAEGDDSFRPQVALLLNLAETHLDYHGGMEDYVASKAKLFANQTEEDTAVLNADDAVSQRCAGLKQRLCRSP